MKKYLSTLIPLLSCVTLLVVFSILKTNMAFAEWWTNSVSRVYYSIFTNLTKFIPFSLTEFFFVSLAVMIIILLVKLIRDLTKKQWSNAINKGIVIANAIISTILVYTLACEMSYNRQRIDLPFYKQEVEAEEFKNVYNYFADDFNYCMSQMHFTHEGDIETDLSFLDISTLVHESVEKNIDSDYFFKTKANVKPMASSFLYRELNITGVTFGVLGEANVNYLSTNLEIPFVVAHEIAHTKGVMREDDANQFAFYVCLNSDHYYLRYSAYALYFYQLTLMTSSSYISEEDIAQLHQVNNNYYLSRRFAANYWKKYNLLDRIGDYINNLYIKSSGVPDGTSSYSGGSEVITDPVTLKLIPSKYQSLFFTTYFNNK